MFTDAQLAELQAFLEEADTGEVLEFFETTSDFLNMLQNYREILGNAFWEAVNSILIVAEKVNDEINANQTVVFGEETHIDYGCDEDDEEYEVEDDLDEDGGEYYSDEDDEGYF